MKKRITLLSLSVLILMSVTPLWSTGSTETPEVIATTSWTAAFADLAGVTDTALLAPYEMQHPSEYELKPSDILAVGQAKMIIFAGYEIMVEKIKESAGNDEVQMVQIKTIMNYPTMEESALKIAAAAGTEDLAVKNLAEMKALLDSSRKELEKAGLFGASVIVHFHQQALARELGFQVAGVYGPGPLQAQQIGDLADVEADLIIDNWHNPVSQPLQEVKPGIKAVQLINFPGREKTRTLYDVVEYNLNRLTE